jgi:hypothetical protein
VSAQSAPGRPHDRAETREGAGQPRPPSLPRCDDCGGKVERPGYLHHRPDCPRVLAAETREGQTRVFVEHSVTFLLAPSERFVVPRRHTRGYAQVDAITVNLFSDRAPRLWVGGIVCKKDGTFSERWGRLNVTVDLPDPAPWIERAQSAVAAGGDE